MNLEQFYEELRKLETTALCVQTVESSREYCKQILEKLEAFAERGVGYKEHAQAVLQCIKSLLKTRKYLSGPPDIIPELCHNIVLRVARVALNWEWLRLADQDELKMAFRQNVMAATTQLPSDEEKQEFQNAVKLLSNDHWREPTLDKILNGDESLTEMEAVNYIRRQEPYVILTRLEMLAGSEETAPIALNMSRWCILDERFSEDVYVRKMLLTQLYLLNRELFHQETVRLPCCLANKVLSSLMQEQPRDLDLCIHCAGTFVVQDWLKPHTYCCTRELLEKWVKLHIEKGAQLNEDDLQENLVKLVNLTQNTLQLTYLIDVLKTQVGERMLGYCSMLCLRALNMDMDIMNKAKEAQAQERWKNSRSNVAHVCHVIYDLFKPYSRDIAREGILAWFSLDSTPSNYHAIEDYYRNEPIRMLEDSGVDLGVIHIESLKVKVIGLINSELVTCINADWSDVQPILISHLESLGFVYDQSSNAFSILTPIPEIGLSTEGSLSPNKMEQSEPLDCSTTLIKPTSIPGGLPMHPPSPPEISEGAINAATAAFFPVKSLGDVIASIATPPCKETQQLSEGTLLNAVLLGTTQTLQHDLGVNATVAPPESPLLMASDSSPTIESKDVLENLEDQKNPQVVSQDLPQTILEENPKEERPRVVSEENPKVVSEESPQCVSDENPKVVSEESPQVVSEENPKVVIEESPQGVSEENPKVVSEESPQIVPEENPKVVSEENSQAVSEENPKIVSEESPQVTSEEIPQVVSGENPKIVSEDNPQIISEENPEVVSGENAKVTPQENPQISKENAKVITQENPPIVSQENPQIITQENPQSSLEPSEAPKITTESPSTPQEDVSLLNVSEIVPSADQSTDEEHAKATPSNGEPSEISEPEEIEIEDKTSIISATEDKAPEGVKASEEENTTGSQSPMSVELEETLVEEVEVNETEPVQNKDTDINEPRDKEDTTTPDTIKANEPIPSEITDEQKNIEQSATEDRQSADQETEIVNVKDIEDNEKETAGGEIDQEEGMEIDVENDIDPNLKESDPPQTNPNENEDVEQSSADISEEYVANTEMQGAEKESNPLEETVAEQIIVADTLEVQITDTADEPPVELERIINTGEVGKDLNPIEDANLTETDIPNVNDNPEVEPEPNQIPTERTECQDEEESITIEPSTEDIVEEQVIEDKKKPTPDKSEIPVEIVEATNKDETAVIDNGEIEGISNETEADIPALEGEGEKDPIESTPNEEPPGIIDQQIITYDIKDYDPSSEQVIIFQEATETNEFSESAQKVSVDDEEQNVTERGYITVELDEGESCDDEIDDDEDDNEKQDAPVVVGREEEPPPPLLEEECGSAGESGSDEMPILSPSIEKLDKDEIDETERSLAEADAILYKAQRVLSQKPKTRKTKKPLKDQPKSYRKIMAKEKEDTDSEPTVSEKEVKKLPPKPKEPQEDQLIKWEQEKDVKSVNLEGGQKMLVVPANHPILKNADLGGVFVPGSVQTVATDLKNAVKFQSGPKFFKSKYYSVGGTGRSMDSDTYKCETCGKYILKSNKKKHDEQKCSKNATNTKPQSEHQKLAYPVKNAEPQSFDISEEQDDAQSNASKDETPKPEAQAPTVENETNAEGFVVINTPAGSNSNTPSVENQNQFTPIDNSEECAMQEQQQQPMGGGYITADGQEFYTADMQHQYIVSEECAPQPQQEQQPESGSFSFLQTSIDLVNFNENVAFDNRPLVDIQKPTQESPEKKPATVVKSEATKETVEEVEPETTEPETETPSAKKKGKDNRCVVCSKRFITRPDLVEHLKTHQSKFMKFRNPPEPIKVVDDDIEEPATAEVSESEIEETKTESSKQYITLEVQKKEPHIVDAKMISLEDFKNDNNINDEEGEEEETKEGFEPFKSKLEPDTDETVKQLQERKVNEDKIREKYFNDIYSKQAVELGATIIKRSRSYLQCPECPATFPSKKCLTKHIQCAHKNTNSGDIKIPKFTSEMIDEILEKVPVTQLVCPICSLGYSTHEGMKKHVLSHKPKPTYYPGRCPVCLSAFPSLIGLKAHMRSHPNFKFCATEKDILPLTALEPSMPSQEQLTSKSKGAIIHDSIKTLTPSSQTCPECNLMFKNRRGVKIHLRHQHPEVYNRLDLEGCPELDMSPLQIAANSVQQATSYSTFRKTIMEQKQKKKIKTVVLGNQKLQVTNPETYGDKGFTSMALPTKVQSNENVQAAKSESEDSYLPEESIEETPVAKQTPMTKQTPGAKDPSNNVQSKTKRKRAAPVDVVNIKSNGSVGKTESQNMRPTSEEPVIKKKRGPVYREQEWDPQKLMQKIEKPKAAVAKRGPRVTRKRSHSPADESEQNDQTITIRIISPAKNRANKRRQAKQKKNAVKAEPPELVMDMDEPGSEAREEPSVDPSLKADAAGRSTIIALMEETTQEKKYQMSELFSTSASGMHLKSGPKTEQEVKDVVMQTEVCDDPNKFSCNICGAIMLKKLWTLHHFMHVPKSRVTAIKTKAGLYFRCIQCKEVFTHKAPVFYHFYKEHKDLMIKSEHNPSAIECHFCGTTCRNLEALHEHLMNHILTTDIEFLQSGELKCLCCKKKLQKEEYFVWHFLSKHADRLVSEME
ncbi:unnamed protein product [Owenia fusiformis]|uniref:C2H2-type domain-containing protein n=1 Tax=Owenia fusiformis TaxID=6347 RepID=A0A8S4NYQ7_OWEFU|nr:unnamed protein product [Owenia fusiformis]